MKKSLYDTDYSAWIDQQVYLMRNKAFNQLDLENLMDEVECLGKSEKRMLKSYLKLLFQHLLKIEYQTEKRTRSWDLTVKNAAFEVNEVLKDNPSLKHKLCEIVNSAYFSAKIEAAKETGLEEKVFPEECPWNIYEILNQGG